jgi:hypothetical protein
MGGGSTSIEHQPHLQTPERNVGIPQNCRVDDHAPEETCRQNEVMGLAAVEFLGAIIAMWRLRYDGPPRKKSPEP